MSPRALRFAAWAVFVLDVVVLFQLLYGVITLPGESPEYTAVRGLAMILGSGLAGMAVVLVVSSKLYSLLGLWFCILFGAVPLLWVTNAIIQSLWG